MARQKNTDPKNVAKVRDTRKVVPSAESIFQGILKGDTAALSKGITLVESKSSSHTDQANTLVELCLGQKTASVRIGITGVPGVGKSTFIETLGKNLTALGKKVAVLAVDPSSTQHKGSILGDKTRMPELAKDPNAFIRPSPTGTSLGGVAGSTREAIVLCEAAGYEVVLVETVGVGQSETMVHSMVDFFLLLKLSGAGDELQGIKRGIIEMADAIAINKADGNQLKMAQLAAAEFQRALQLYPPKENGWVPTVVCCSAIENTGIVPLWDIINDYITQARASGYLVTKRKLQNKQWLLQTIDTHLKLAFYGNKAVAATLKELTEQIMENKISAFRATDLLMKRWKKELK